MDSRPVMSHPGDRDYNEYHLAMHGEGLWTEGAQRAAQSPPVRAAYARAWASMSWPQEMVPDEGHLNCFRPGGFGPGTAPQEAG